MPAGVTRYLDFETGFPNIWVRVKCVETYDVPSNTSSITIYPSIYVTSPAPNTDAYPDFTVKVNGTTVISVNSSGSYYTYYMTTANTNYPINYNRGEVSGTLNSIEHDSDGNLTITVSIAGNRFSKSSIYLGNGTETTADGSGTMQMTTIPRITVVSLSSSTIEMGTPVTVNMPRHVSSYTHTLSYSFQGTSAVIARNLGTSYTWTPPISLAANIPTATRATGVLTCQTYSGSTLLGSTTVNFTLTVPESVLPRSVSLSLENVSDSAAVASWGMSGITQGYSKLKISAEMAASYATIASYTIKYAQGSFYGSPGTASHTAVHTTAILSSVGYGVITVTVKDSRGREFTTAYNNSYFVEAYSPPVLNNTVAQRYTTQPSVRDDDGRNLAVRASADCSPVNGHNSIAYLRFRYKERSSATWSGYYNLANGIFSTLENVLEDTKSYNVEIITSDRVTTSTVRIIVATAQTTINCKPGGKAVGIGAYATTDNSLELATGWRLIMSDENSGGTVTLTASQLKALLALLR